MPDQAPTYFEIFSLPPHLVIDTPALEKSFYALSRKLHPDRFASRPPAEQEAALAESSRLNDAYRTTGTAKRQVVPEDLLEEAFELNMQLEEMRMAKKMGEDDPQLRKDLLAAKTTFDAKMAATDADLATLHARWDAALSIENAAASDPIAKAAVRDAMVALLNRRSYLRNLVRDVNNALET
jgi:molecular chaperone HscB